MRPSPTAEHVGAQRDALLDPIAPWTWAVWSARDSERRDPLMWVQHLDTRVELVRTAGFAKVAVAGYAVPGRFGDIARRLSGAHHAAVFVVQWRMVDDFARRTVMREVEHQLADQLVWEVFGVRLGPGFACSVVAFSWTFFTTRGAPSTGRNLWLHTIHRPPATTPRAWRSEGAPLDTRSGDAWHRPNHTRAMWPGIGARRPNPASASVSNTPPQARTADTICLSALGQETRHVMRPNSVRGRPPSKTQFRSVFRNGPSR
jgi:hypothetical protein